MISDISNLKGKICIFGGTFNPPHKAHKDMALKVLSEFDLGSIIFMPTGDSYLKNHVLSPEIRLKMTEMLCDENDKFFVSDYEASKEGPSYTYETLECIRERSPEADIYFLMGEDSLRYLESWRHPEIILDIAGIIVLRRDDESSFFKDDDRSFEDVIKALKDRFDARIYPVIFDEDISSSAIRSAFAEGRGEEVKDWLSPKVYDYIVSRNIYRQ